MSKPLILIIDDETDIIKLLKYNLEKEGYEALFAKTGEQGLELAKEKLPQLILLDLMLPGLDGFGTCKLLRGTSETKNIPILILSAKSSEIDQVVGLELGAADYITKPFSIKVLLARIKKFLKSQPAKEEAAVLKTGDFLLDRERVVFSIKGKPVGLTKLEFTILGILMENQGKVMSRQKLVSTAWGPQSVVTDITVNMHLRGIRKKLGKHRNAVETVRGSGYRLSESL